MVEERSLRWRPRAALFGMALTLVAACGRSERDDGGDDDAVTPGGAGGGGAGGASGGGAGGASAAGKGGTGGGAGTGAASGSGGSAGKADCSALSDAYESAVAQAETCDPAATSDPCTKLIGVGLECGQDEFANPDQTDALAALQAASDAYTAGACRMSVMCGQSGTPIGAHCSAAGHCETVFDNGGRGCKVNGQVYSHGTSGIPAPDGCNTCSCDDGVLGCTEIGCMNDPPCPVGMATGTQCALCGPTDACQVVEYGCFKTCVDGCAEMGASCIAGLCLTSVCG